MIGLMKVHQRRVFMAGLLMGVLAVVALHGVTEIPTPRPAAANSDPVQNVDRNVAALAHALQEIRLGVEEAQRDLNQVRVAEYGMVAPPVGLQLQAQTPRQAAIQAVQARLAAIGARQQQLLMMLAQLPGQGAP